MIQYQFSPRLLITVRRFCFINFFCFLAIWSETGNVSLLFQVLKRKNLTTFFALFRLMYIKHIASLHSETKSTMFLLSFCFRFFFSLWIFRFPSNSLQIFHFVSPSHCCCPWYPVVFDTGVDPPYPMFWSSCCSLSLCSNWRPCCFSHSSCCWRLCYAVLGIRDTLVRIRIQIRLPIQFQLRIRLISSMTLRM